MTNKLPISREEALLLIREYNSDERDIIHYLESEVIMKEVAEKIGEDINYWGMLGLLHDIDWGITKENVETHLTKAPEILSEAGFDDKFIETVLSHGYGYEELPHLKNKVRNDKIHFALAASETLTGLIHAYALMRDGKVSDMEVKGLKKKFKDKAFAAKVNRDIILECEKFGLNLDEFLEIGINALNKIKEEVELK